jgi:hypothetical protein
MTTASGRSILFLGFPRSIEPPKIRVSTGSGARIFARRALFEPLCEIAQRVRKPPLIQHRARDRRSRSGRLSSLRFVHVIHQPRLEGVRLGILRDHMLKQAPFDIEPYRIGRLVALALLPASLGRLERREQRLAYECRA